MSDGFGFITWWGFSPSLDLRKLDEAICMKNINITDGEKEEFNILLIGASDVRHIITTIAKAYKHSKKRLNFYILESNVEIYARQMILMSIALEQQNRYGLQDKTELFLEIFGNSLIRRQCIDYIEKISAQFIKMVTDLEYCSKVYPCIDLSLLKFKERDMLEGVFKFWKNTKNEKLTYDADKCWNLRLRKHLGPRYDAVPNVFSWDHGMKLGCKDASIIHSKEYNQWREYGVAFGIREGTYDMPNRTLANAKLFLMDGERHVRIGYWGDIVTSPYISFGIECEEKSFFKLANNQHTKTAQDVSEYNISSLLHEIIHQEPYVVVEEPKIKEIIEEEDEDADDADVDEKKGCTDEDDLNKDEFRSIEIDGAKITFLPIVYAQEMHKKSQFKHIFQSVFISNSMFHNLNSNLSSTFADGCQVICETAKFMLDFNKEQNENFLSRMAEMCNEAGCQIMKPCDPEKDAFAYYEYKEK